MLNKIKNFWAMWWAQLIKLAELECNIQCGRWM